MVWCIEREHSGESEYGNKRVQCGNKDYERKSGDVVSGKSILC